MSETPYHAKGSGHSEGHEYHDIAPGDEEEGHSGVAHGIRGYVVGLALASALTIASFWIAASQNAIWQPGVPVMLIVLAIAQIGIHLIFFLHITSGPDNTNNILALAFGFLIVFLVVAGSLWIMANLNHNMMPMEHMLGMQR
jgi:cytochrome o ubiquinol oxidase subunit IV